MSPTSTPSDDMWRTDEVIGSRLVDPTAKRTYARGRVDGEQKTVVLALADEQLLTAYDLVGELALDSTNGWLYIDQGQAGLAVVNTRREQLHTIIPLPESASPYSSPPPQADPASARVLAFRDNVIYIADPHTGSILDTIVVENIQYYACYPKRPVDQKPYIDWTVYDPTARILYLAFRVYDCPSTGFTPVYTIASYDMTANTEITQNSSNMLSWAYAADGYLLQALRHKALDGYLSKRQIWRGGQPWISSVGWDTDGLIDFDPTRRRFYEVTSNPDSFRVYDAETMALMMLLPRPLEGSFEGYDSETDRLYFRIEGQLQTWPGSAIHPPVPEPLTTAPLPTTAVHFLAVSPNWPVDQTLFGIWWNPSKVDTTSENCHLQGQTGFLLYISRDGGQTWEQSRSGLRGSCELFTTLAVSPNYAHDQTLLVGILGLGIFKSTDGGQLWQPSGAGLTHMGIHEILLSPGFAGDHTAFARTYVAGETILFRSTDGGNTWQALANPGPDLEGHWYKLALSPEFAKDHTLMGIFFNASTQQIQLYISHDGGEQWELVGEMPTGVSPHQSFSLAPIFAKWQTLFAAGNGNLYRSSDSGRNWMVVLTELSSVKQLVYTPGVEYKRPVFLLAGEIVYRSGDGGQTWAELELPSDIVPTALAISPIFAQDGLLFVGTKDGQVITIAGTK
jgi:photosystem II stability/assembly factor-like uncharacterized protein